MRVLFPALLTIFACHPAADRPDDHGGVIAVEAYHPTPAQLAATPWTPQAACDSAAAVGRREVPGVTPAMGAGTIRIGDGPPRPACTVTIAGHGTPAGEPPVTFDRGIGGTDWVRDIQFESDGAYGTGYGFRRPGAVCKVSQRWDESNNFTITVSCAADSPVSETTPGTVAATGPVAEDTTAVPVRWRTYRIVSSDSVQRCIRTDDTKDQFTVVVRGYSAEERDGVPGEDIFVRHAPSLACSADSLPGDLVIRAGFFSRFRGMIDGTILVEEGDANSYSGLQLYDWASHRQVADLSIADLEGGGPAGTIGAWVTDTLDPKRMCPPESQVRVQQFVWVTLTTGAQAPAGRRRCRFEE